MCIYIHVYENDPAFDLLINYLFQLQCLKLTYRKKDHCMDIYPLWIKCSVWSPLRLAAPSTWTVMLLIRLLDRTYPQLSRCRPEWLVLSVPLLFAAFSENFSLRNPQRNKSHGFESGLFGDQTCPHAKRSGNRFEMSRETTACMACLHPTWITESVKANL
jgi:hypothetical protein